jgi:hypothetical protein
MLLTKLTGLQMKIGLHRGLTRTVLVMGLCFSGLSSFVLAAPAQKLAVKVTNDSEPVLCAEKDNVALTFSSPQVQSFQVQVTHPPYIGLITHDQDAPDFTSCDMSADPVFGADHPKRVTLFESDDLWVVGFTFNAFWRPNTVPIKIGDKTFEGLHMLQVWVRHQERAEEVMVLYPPDGYWRARPLAYRDMRWTAYGSSFLVGPIEVLGRPVVVLNDITFDPAARRFDLSFKQGGTGSVTIKTIDRAHQVIDVTLKGTPKQLPFASFRSMYVTRANADVADVAWLELNQPGWLETPIMNFKGANVTELWAGRNSASRHNLSAPDMIFGRFSQ